MRSSYAPASSPARLPLEGDDYTVVIETKVNARIDSRAMRRHVDERIWRPYLIATPTVYVRTERKTIAPELKTRSRAPT